MNQLSSRYMISWPHSCRSLSKKMSSSYISNSILSYRLLSILSPDSWDDHCPDLRSATQGSGASHRSHFRYLNPVRFNYEVLKEMTFLGDVHGSGDKVASAFFAFLFVVQFYTAADCTTQCSPENTVAYLEILHICRR